MRLQGDESERIETMSNAEIQAEVMGVLRKMYPNITVPEPDSITLPRWFSDPLYRGSWSNWPPRSVRVLFFIAEPHNLNKCLFGTTQPRIDRRL